MTLIIALGLIWAKHQILRLFICLCTAPCQFVFIYVYVLLPSCEFISIHLYCRYCTISISFPLRFNIGHHVRLTCMKDLSTALTMILRAYLVQNTTIKSTVRASVSHESLMGQLEVIKTYVCFKISMLLQQRYTGIWQICQNLTAIEFS